MKKLNKQVSIAVLLLFIAFPASGALRLDPAEAQREMTVWFGEGQIRLSGIAETEDGGWLVAGTCEISRQFQFGRLMKVSGKGDLEWTRDFERRDLEWRGMTVSEEGTFLIVGSDSPTYSDRQLPDFSQPFVLEDPGTGEQFIVEDQIFSDLWACRADLNGDVIWEKRFNSDGDSYGTSVMTRLDGSLVLAGTSFIGDKPVGRLVWSSGDGRAEREETYAFADGWICDGAVMTSDGNILIGGTVNAISRESARIVLVMADMEGQEVWSKEIESTEAEILSSMVEIPGGLVALAGSAYSLDKGSVGFLKVVDAKGEVLWSRHYGLDAFSDIVSAPDGSLLAAGEGTVIAVDRNGDLLWHVRPEGIDAYGPSLVRVIDERRILLLGNAVPPREENVPFSGSQGFLTILSR